MQRSSHLIDRSIASFIRALSGDVVAITSSSCIIMSEPMEFWREMECSGVRSLAGCQRACPDKSFEECLHRGTVMWT